MLPYRLQCPGLFLAVLMGHTTTDIIKSAREIPHRCFLHDIITALLKCKVQIFCDIMLCGIFELLG